MKKVRKLRKIPKKMKFERKILKFAIFALLLCGFVRSEHTKVATCGDGFSICIIRHENVEFDEKLRFKQGLLSIKDEVKDLTFVLSSVSIVPREVFSTFPNLEKLRLKDQKVKEILPNSFENAKNLEILNLNKNRIKTLTAETFKGAENLEEIYLGHNRIQTIDKDALKNLNRLRILTLNDNKLKNLHESVFHTNFALKILIMPRNQLDELPGQIFQDNPNLWMVSLRYNKIKTLSATMFSHLEKLEILFMEKNFCIDENYKHFKSDFVRIEADLQPCVDN